MSDLSRFTWERELIKHGPEKPTTRHVLLTIGLYVRRKGSLDCWPSISKLMEATRLSNRCVIDCINEAESMGWISKRQGQMQGMTRRGSIYSLRLPAVTGEARSQVGADRGASKLSENKYVAIESQNAGLVKHDTLRQVNAPAPTGERGDVQPVNVAAALLTSRSKEEIKELEVPPSAEGEKRFFSFLKKSKEKATATAKGQNQGPLQGGVEAWALGVGLYRETGESEREFKIRAGLAYAQMQTRAVA